MNQDRQAPAPTGDSQLDRHVRQQLDKIEKEDTPEHLLTLAQELQRLLRKTDT